MLHITYLKLRKTEYNINLMRFRPPKIVSVTNKTFISKSWLESKINEASQGRTLVSEIGQILRGMLR